MKDPYSPVGIMMCSSRRHGLRVDPRVLEPWVQFIRMFQAVRLIRFSSSLVFTGAYYLPCAGFLHIVVFNKVSSIYRSNSYYSIVVVSHLELS